MLRTKTMVFRAISVASAALLVTACSSPKKQQASPSATAVNSSGRSWSGQMQGMAEQLQELMPFVFSRAEFTDAENAKRIRGLLVDFEKSVELVPQHTGEVLLGKDPLVQFSIQRMRSNAQQAIKAFDENHLEFSRHIVRENTGLCFNCHTTTQLGPENNFSTKAIPPTFRIQPTEKAEYYVATRQFDRATHLLEQVLESTASWLDNPHEQVGAMRRYLAVQVRVKKDPADAALTIEKFLKNKKLPYFVATDTEAWLQGLHDWQKSLKRQVGSYKLAQELLAKAAKKQTAGGYQAGYVEYLRASSLLHESLRGAKTAQQRAEIYRLLGDCYDTLSETGTWDLPEVYFESCVRAAPKTIVSQRCYKDFEKAIVMGYSGSAGVFIPKEERERLSELKTLSGLMQ